MQRLASRPRFTISQSAPNPMPPLPEAQQLLDNYFTRFHPSHAFLLRGDLLTTFHRIYRSERDTSIPSKQDYFRLFMMFAISSTTRYRTGQSSAHPYGYFVAAEKYMAEVPLIKDIDAIQNLLMIARFGMYYHIGTSLWEISHLCMRQCIEWQLHSDNAPKTTPLLEQHRRRIFWECYIIDRYHSGILGRPFAILVGGVMGV